MFRLSQLTKDFILRSQMMQGNRVHFRPGWDCHGLPIELKAKQIEAGMSASEIRDNGASELTNSTDSSPILGALANVFLTSFFPFRPLNLARNFAAETVERQKAAFESWGVLADWDLPTGTYRTIDPDYVQNQLRIFHQLYEKQLIVRDFKPVYWSTSSK